MRAQIDAEVEGDGLPASVGAYLQLIACNRASAPCAKLRLRRWYEQTALAAELGVAASALDHRRVWDAMDRVSEAAIERVQERLGERLVELGELEEGEVLVFDPTNLFTFIASANERSQLARRGHSKQGRHDLRQVGLALVTTRGHRLPLLHHVYAGDRPDAPTFRELAERLQRRFRTVLEVAESVTLVYDRGSHSDRALTLFEPGEFHFVCGLQANRFRERLEVAPDRLAAIAELPGYQAHRSAVTIEGRRYTLLCVRSQSFFQRQQEGFRQTLAKALRELTALARPLELGRGRRTRSELAAVVASILEPRYVQRVLAVAVGGSQQAPTLSYRLDEQALALLEERVFGRSLLLTDRADWSEADIVRAYHALNANEEAIRTVKDAHYLAARPIFHWTDQKIRVHVFCCVLGLLLTQLIWKRADARGLEASPQRLLEALAQLDRIELVYPPAGGGRGRPRIRRHLGEPSGLQLDLLAALDFDPERVGTTPPGS